MRKTFITVAALLLLSTGCTTVTKTEIQRVEVEVPVSCIKELPEKPLEPTRTIERSDDIYIKVQKILSELDFRKAYEIKLETILEGCKLKNGN